MKVLIESDELAKDVAGAEALLERHLENKVSIMKILLPWENNTWQDAVWGGDGDKYIEGIIHPSNNDVIHRKALKSVSFNEFSQIANIDWLHIGTKGWTT